MKEIPSWVSSVFTKHKVGLFEFMQTGDFKFTIRTEDGPSERLIEDLRELFPAHEFEIGKLPKSDQSLLPGMTLPTGGVKHDSGKVQLGLISTKFLNGLGSVLTFGAKKYAAHNWRGGFPTSRLYDALQRHLTAWNDGEDKDPESKLPHLYHAACCLMFLCEQMETKPELDNRFRPKLAKEKTIDDWVKAPSISIHDLNRQMPGIPKGWEHEKSK